MPTVTAQPTNPTQVCSFSNATNAPITGDISNLDISCSTATFPVNLAVTGFVSQSVVFQNNGGDNLTIGGNGTFPFQTSLPSGATYSVTELGGTQVCNVSNPTGTVGNGPVTLNVNCTDFAQGPLSATNANGLFCNSSAVGPVGQNTITVPNAVTGNVSKVIVTLHGYSVKLGEDIVAALVHNDLQGNAKTVALFQFSQACSLNSSNQFAMSGDYVLTDDAPTFIDQAFSNGKLLAGSYKPHSALDGPMTGTPMAGNWTLGLASVSPNASASLAWWQLHLE
jgi:hypothetical protein